MDTFKEATDKILDFRNKRNWKQFHKPKDMALSLVLETSELLEHFQWKNDNEFENYLKEKKVEFSEELADILYWVLLIAHDTDIDLPDAFQKKLLRNEEKYPVEKASNSAKKYTELLNSD